MRAMVLDRHGWRCHLCGHGIASEAELHIDHVVPWAEGGRTTLENLRPAHASCHLSKGRAGR